MRKIEREENERRGESERTFRGCNGSGEYETEEIKLERLRVVRWGRLRERSATESEL